MAPGRGPNIMPVRLSGGPYDGREAPNLDGTDFSVYLVWSEMGQWGDSDDLDTARRSDFPCHAYKWDGETLQYDGKYGGI